MYKSKISPNSIPEFPNILVAALTNACTHKCDFCQYKNYSTNPDYILKHLDAKVFEKIVDEMSDKKNTALRLCAWGEPLMHPDIVRFVDYASSKNVKTVLLTNGYLLDPELSLELMKAGLSFTEISVDAAKIETYQKVRVCDDEMAFFKVKDNAKEMIRIRNQFNFETKIVVSYVTWPTKESEEEFVNFKNEWVYLADDIVKRRLHSFMCAVDPGLIEVPEDRLPCYGLWARATVNPWGKIVICYNQWEKDKWAVADLNDSHATIAHSWMYGKFSQMRREQVAGVYTGPCENCKDYNPFAWEHPFEEVIEKVDVMVKN